MRDTIQRAARLRLRRSARLGSAGRVLDASCGVNRFDLTPDPFPHGKGNQNGDGPRLLMSFKSEVASDCRPSVGNRIAQSSATQPA